MYIPKDIWLVKHGTRDIAFFVPKPEEEVNTTQATFEKRQSTALNWASGGPYSKRVPVELLTQHEFSNDFQHGFKFITTSGRWQTEAEYIVIQHPNGYSFEIYTSNLLEVLRADGCAKGGVLNGKYKMFYNMNGKWSIFSEGSSLEPEMNKLNAETRKQNAQKKKSKSIRFTEGMVVKIGNDNHEWVYVGKQELDIVGSMGEISYRNFSRIREAVVYGTREWKFEGGKCTITRNLKEVTTDWRTDKYELSENLRTAEEVIPFEVPKLLTFVTKGGNICQFKSKSVYIVPIDDGAKFNQEVVEQFKSGKLYSFDNPTYSSGFDYEDLLLQVGWYKPKNSYGYSFNARDEHSEKVAKLDNQPKIGDTWDPYQPNKPYKSIGCGDWGGFKVTPHVKLKIKELK